MAESYSDALRKMYDLGVEHGKWLGRKELEIEILKKELEEIRKRG